MIRTKCILVTYKVPIICLQDLYLGRGTYSVLCCISSLASELKLNVLRHFEPRSWWKKKQSCDTKKYTSNKVVRAVHRKFKHKHFTLYLSELDIRTSINAGEKVFKFHSVIYFIDFRQPSTASEKSPQKEIFFHILLHAALKVKNFRSLAPFKYTYRHQSYINKTSRAVWVFITLLFPT